MNNDLQRLAVMQALYKQLGKEVGTRSDGLRAQLDADLLDAYMADGTDRRRITINGEQVGYLSVRFAKERARAIAEDAGALADCLLDEHPSIIRSYIVENAQKVADYAIDHMDGELPDGVTAYIEPTHPDGTVLKGCEFEDVVGALGLNLPQAMAYALTEGGE